MVKYIWVGLILFAISALLVRQFIDIAKALNIVDIPNSRSSHCLPTVRGGGIIICLLSCISIAAMGLSGHLSIRLALSLGCSCIVSMIGFLDDLKGLNIKLRFILQLIVSAVAVGLIIPLEVPVNLVNIALLISSSFFVVWSTNLFNFMDGIDGFAAIEAMFVLIIAGIVLFFSTTEPMFSVLLWVISGIVAGFLWFNLPPAKIFMGDCGSYFLGFLIAVSALISHFIFKVSLGFWLIIYAAFLFDTTITLVRRFLSGEKWYLSHRSHAYQRLQNIGWRHKDIVYGLIIVNIFLLNLVIIGYYSNLVLPGVLAILGLSIIYLIIELGTKNNEKNI